MSWLLTAIALTTAGSLPCTALPFAAPIIAQTNVPTTSGTTNAPAVPQGTSVSGASAPANGSQGSGVPDGVPPQQSPWPTLIMFGVIFLIFWLFIIRPQSKKAKDHQNMVKALQKGDEVVTQSGIFGRITGFDDAAGAVVIEIAKDTRIRVLRGQVGAMQQKQESNS